MFWPQSFNVELPLMAELKVMKRKDSWLMPQAFAVLRFEVLLNMFFHLLSAIRIISRDLKCLFCSRSRSANLIELPFQKWNLYC
jgi:hypothetical protein